MHNICATKLFSKIISLSESGGLAKEHITKIIPDSLYLFLSILLGGIDVLDSD